MKIESGMIFAPTDKRRTNRRIRVIGKQLVTTFSVGYARVESRLVGQRKWVPAPAIRLDRLESRAYKLVRK